MTLKTSCLKYGKYFKMKINLLKRVKKIVAKKEIAQNEFGRFLD